MKTFALAALFGAMFIAPAQAEDITINNGLAAGSLHEGALDMVAYWTEGAEGALEVTATFRDPSTTNEPMRIVMPMQDGDDVAFGMPGYEGSLYRFLRVRDEIWISVEAVPHRVASAN